MRIIRDYQFIADKDRGACVAIGNFDGVHLGHQAVIDVVRGIADKSGSPLGILTFEPHPREYFAPSAPNFKLMGADAKANRLEKLGVEHLYQLNFNAALSALDAREFARDVIHGALGLTHVVVGADFCFGKGRKGNAETSGRLWSKNSVLALPSRNWSKTANRFSPPQQSVTHCPKVDLKMLQTCWVTGTVSKAPSSKAINAAANLGFPTANMSIDGLHPPKYGVYAVTVDILDGPSKGRYFGAASIGERPTFRCLQTKPRSLLIRFPRRHLRRKHFRRIDRLPTPRT